MTKPEFHNLLHEVSVKAMRFAEHFITDKLVSDFRYNVILNASFDQDIPGKFKVFPEDEGGLVLDLTEEKVVELLWRENKCPVWIDINVLKSGKRSTTFNLLCAGRYSDDENEFYYHKQGTGPFGIKSPKLPANFEDGKKFKL
ncbi:hypothetical protein [Flavobacterium silvaticum]|uniref:Uncharacterized protein n=1 Tax=Flavobacterium silvaticum TaxID=1852020 RepID=A0A972FS05_9FLAO|nr:hypothetical protein [Flavobacterium silvaticum]NMH27428.1 hypothetical protein [Flavobacterium silvaticum]